MAPRRRVLETEGGLLGLGPPEAQPGDEIWLVNGGRMPLFLRPLVDTDGAGDKHTLMGEVPDNAQGDDGSKPDVKVRGSCHCADK